MDHIARMYTQAFCKIQFHIRYMIYEKHRYIITVNRENIHSTYGLYSQHEIQQTTYKLTIVFVIYLYTVLSKKYQQENEHYFIIKPTYRQSAFVKSQ